MAHGNRSWIDDKRTPELSPAAVYLNRLGAGSRRSMVQSLATLAALAAGEGADPLRFRWELLRRDQTVAMRAELMSRLKPATVNKMLSALRGVLRAARDMRLMAERDFQTAASLESVGAKHRGQHARTTRVTPVVLHRLFDACTRDDQAANRRDAALLAIFLSSGLRRSEATALDVRDYDMKSGRLHIRGERPEYDRYVQLGGAARQAVDHWLELRSLEAGSLLLPVNRSGLIQFRKLTDQAVYDILSRIVKRAKLRDVTSRALRRAYVLSLIHAGKSPAEVRDLVGRASWLTTAMYHRLADEKDQDGYDVANLPYHLPKGA